MNDILSFKLLSEEEMESDEEEEGGVPVFRSPVRRGRSKVDSSPSIAKMKTRSIVNTKKRTRTAPKRTTTNAKSSPQNGRESF